MIQHCKSLVTRLVSEDSEHHLLQRAFLFAGLGIAGVVMFWFLYLRWRGNTEKWFEKRNLELDNQVVYNWCVDLHTGQEALCSRLAEQAGLAEIRAIFHFDLFSHYASEHFASASVAFWAAVFVAACLAYIAKKGWETTHNVVTTCFIAFSIHLAFFQGFPMLAKHVENISENERLYLDHMNLRQEIRTYVVTGMAHDEPMDLDAFVSHIDTRLIELNRIPLEFDASKVNAGAVNLLEHQPE